MRTLYCFYLIGENISANLDKYPAVYIDSIRSVNNYQMVLYAFTIDKKAMKDYRDIHNDSLVMKKIIYDKDDEDYEKFIEDNGELEIEYIDIITKKSENGNIKSSLIKLPMTFREYDILQEYNLVDIFADSKYLHEDECDLLSKMMIHEVFHKDILNILNDVFLLSDALTLLGFMLSDDNNYFLSNGFTAINQFEIYTKIYKSILKG